VSGLLTVKLRRDLRATWPRMLLMVIAIAVSLTAFGGVLSAWAASGRETSNAYMSTEPASATIVLDRPIDAEQMATIAAQTRRRPGVIEATGRTQFTSESVQVNGRSRDIPLQVFVATADDPMRMATFQMRQRDWPPSPGELFVGRDSLSLLGVAVGDTVTVETPSGEPVRLRVADTVYDPSLSPSPQEQTGRGYLSAASLPGPGGQAGLDQLKLQVADPGQTTPSRDRDAIVAKAGEVGTWLQRERGLAVREIQVPKPYAHPHQWQADALLGSLLAGGAAALLLATMLAATMLNGLFTQQIPQIGIMKAIGARSGRIGRLYLAMTLLVALGATLLALPLAILLGRVAVGQFLGFLGIKPASLAAPWWTYVVVLAVGLGLPPLLALLPLVKTSRTTVRAAIDHHGGGAKPSGATGVLARLGRMRGLDRGLLMALRNTIRRPARFWLSVGLLASAGMVFVAGMSLSAGTQAITDEQKQQRTWDVDVQLASPASVDAVTTMVERVPDVGRVEAFNVAQTGVAGPGQIPVTRTYPDQGHGRVSVTALPAGTTMFTPPKLLEGRWLNPGETGAVVLNQVTRNNTLPGIHAGDTVQLLVGGKPTTWRVVGLAEERTGGSGVYTTAEGLAVATGQPQRANQLRVATNRHDEQTRQAVADAINRTLTNAGVEVKSAASVSRSEAISEGHLGPVILILLGIALPLGVVGVIGLASTMSANVLDRTREFGVMHAIGARPKAVRRIVVAEGVFLALASFLVAALPALGLTAVLGAGLGNLFFAAPLPYRISIPAIGIWLALVILGAALATEAAATRASRITVREALTYL
jgi:putative ABC transport system permease protein